MTFKAIKIVSMIGAGLFLSLGIVAAVFSDKTGVLINVIISAAWVMLYRKLK